MEAKANLRNLQISPYKARLVADLIRGKRAQTGLDLLAHSSKAAAVPMRKVLFSAVSNAKDKNAKPEDLVIRSVQVNGARGLKRIKPRARGRADRMVKRACHIHIVVSDNK